MMCEDGCAVKVREVLSKQPGVKRVKVDFPKRVAILAVDKSEFSTDDAVAALVDHGFEHSKLKTDNLPVAPIDRTQPPAAAQPATSTE
jgi:copper chaperone CopZ